MLLVLIDLITKLGLLLTGAVNQILVRQINKIILKHENKVNQFNGAIWGILKYLGVTLVWQTNIIFN